MSKRRKLTDDERKKVYDYAYKQAKAAYEGHTVRVIVDDELDDKGHANWKVMATSETIVPNT